MKIKLKKFKNVKSTNNIAIKLIKKNFYEPTLIISERQSKGKGTMGKKWISQKGNLFITLFFKLDKKKINFKQFSVLNALILKRIITKQVSKKINIKWPNDLLYKKEKICGILQEVINFKQFRYLIVGIGLNTNKAPQNKSFSSTCLKNIVKNKVNNKLILENIIKVYEKFLNETKKFSFPELRDKYR